MFPQQQSGNILSICHRDDPLCHGIPLPILGHLTYLRDVGRVASWIYNRTEALVARDDEGSPEI